MTTKRFDLFRRLRRSAPENERGFVLIYMSVMLTALLLFTGLALDGGRAYVVQAQLSKAVDGAALGAARMLNSGDPQAEATSIFNANFPVGYMGTTAVMSPPGFQLTPDEPNGRNIVRVWSNATMPTTFMKLGNIFNVTVSAEGEATRRMVDLSLVLDVSGSIGWRWPYVRDASEAFVSAFSESQDRVALMTYSNGARVWDQMRDTRGFDKGSVLNHIPTNLPGGSTAMVEGLYRGWDELRAVPRANQSSLRVIVLFTDGASNSVPGDWNGGAAKGLRTWDFPNNGADPDNQTHQRPHISGFFDTETGAATNPSPNGFTQDFQWDCRTPFNSCTRPEARWMVQRSRHTHGRSAGIPTQFDLQTGTLNVNGQPQNVRRGLRDLTAGQYPAHVININNAARNLVEIIGNAARADTSGAYRIRIYSIGMGELVRYDLGSIPETSESILMRVANDRRSPDFNSAQLEGKFFFAETQDDVGAAFNQLLNEIIRLTR
jgi:Flp pilus assembly protein TadG